jgi:hypothetical protein
MAKTNKAVIGSVDGNAPALVISPGKAPVVTGNWDDIKNYLVATRDKYKGVDFLKMDPVELSAVKKEMQILRTSLEKIETTVKKTYFNDPKTVFTASMAALYALVKEVENPVDAGLTKHDQVRIDNLNMALDAYIDVLIKEYSLTERYAALIVKRDKYYNKTQEESDSLSDILAQVTDLAKQQKAYISGQKLISASCAKDKRLHTDMYLKQLYDGEEIAVILEEIENEKARLEAIDNEPVADAQADSEAGESGEAESGTQTEEAGAEAEAGTSGETEKVVLGAASTIDWGSDLPDRTKTITVEITYPADCAKALTELFRLLAEKGIQSKVVETKKSVF